MSTIAESVRPSPLSPLYRALTAPFRALRRAWEEMVALGVLPDGCGRHRLLLDVIPVTSVEVELALAEVEIGETAASLEVVESGLAELPAKALRAKDPLALHRLLDREATRLRSILADIRGKRLLPIAERVGEERDQLESLHPHLKLGVRR